MLTQERINDIVKFIYSEENVRRIEEDKKRYEIYNGQLKKIIQDAIYREFILPESVKDMLHRIVPINITQKIINKLSKVYVEAPIRKPKEDMEQDEEALQRYEDLLQINKQMKSANRMFKLFKHTLLEPFLDRNSIPKLRVLPSYQYTPTTTDEMDYSYPTEITKHISFGSDISKDRHIIWDEDSQVMIDGKGNPIPDTNNPDFINPYGVLPFEYINECQDRLIPLSDDDLISMQIQINLLLTDLSFAAKFQSWSIWVLKGGTTQKLSFNPNSIVTLPADRDGNTPELTSIKPTLDSDQMLRQVEALVGMLLTTKSLSIGSVSTKLDSSNAQTGIAKILDGAETTEDRNDQIEYFKKAEENFWGKFAKNILPIWVQNGLIDPNYVSLFTPSFELSIIFPEQKMLISEKDKIELIKAKEDAGLITHRMALELANPHMDEDELDQLEKNIQDEKAQSFSDEQNNELTFEKAEQEDTIN